MFENNVIKWSRNIFFDKRWARLPHIQSIVIYLKIVSGQKCKPYRWHNKIAIGTNPNPISHPWRFQNEEFMWFLYFIELLFFLTCTIKTKMIACNGQTSGQCRFFARKISQNMHNKKDIHSFVALEQEKLATFDWNQR